MTKQEPVGYLSEGGAERLVIKKQAHEQIRNFTPKFSSGM